MGSAWWWGGVQGVGRAEGGRWDALGWTFAPGAGGGAGVTSGLRLRDYSLVGG